MCHWQISQHGIVASLTVMESRLNCCSSSEICRGLRGGSKGQCLLRRRDPFKSSPVHDRILLERFLRCTNGNLRTQELHGGMTYVVEQMILRVLGVGSQHGRHGGVGIVRARTTDVYGCNRADRLQLEEHMCPIGK